MSPFADDRGRSRPSTSRSCSTPRPASTGSSPSRTAGSAFTQGGPRTGSSASTLLRADRVPGARTRPTPWPTAWRGPGINLVRLGDLDTPLGPDRSLFDDTRDDTKAFDPIALARLDHLIAALKARGIYVALELQSIRRFRADDGVAAPACCRPAAGRRPFRPDHQQAGARGAPGPCSTTSTPRPAWRSATTRCWPG